MRETELEVVRETDEPDLATWLEGVVRAEGAALAAHMDRLEAARAWVAEVHDLAAKWGKTVSLDDWFSYQRDDLSIAHAEALAARTALDEGGGPVCRT